MSRASLFLGALLALSTGCQGVYTSIYRVDDNTYYLTRTKQGFFKTYGTLFVCKPIENSADLQCREIDSP